MMLDFQAVRDGQTNLAELTAGLTRQDLASLTNEMLETILKLIADCEDSDVIFDPVDPQAYDPHAATEAEIAMPWTLGHVIVHITASAEESAALAAELARGVAFHGRARYETPWMEMKTILGCRRRLEDSRRMCLASLDMWPQDVHLDNEIQAWPDGPIVNAIGRFVLGLMHTESHLGQIEDIVKQARTARS
jgi:hypothetical protein